MKEFSIIIPVYQEYNIFELFINSLLNSIEYSSQIILIDDNSPSLVSKKIEELNNFKTQNYKIHSIRHNTNYGSAKSINEALPLVDGEFVILLDSDTILKTGWQSTVKKSFCSSDIGGVGAVLLYPQSGGVQCCGITYTYATSRHLKLNASPESVGKKIYEVQASIFAFFATKSDIINKIGALDLSYFNGYEDIDYQMRMRKSGYKIIINPELQFHHWEKSNGIHREYNRRSNLALLWKKYGDFIKEDLWDFIFNELKQYNLSMPYIGVDLCSSRLDAETFWKQIDENMSLLISEHIDYSYNLNGNATIWLPQVMHYDFFRTPQPILFLCDNFIQLLDNKYWFQFRQNYSPNDLIIDLYGNVLPFSILKESFWPGNKIR